MKALLHRRGAAPAGGGPLIAALFLSGAVTVLLLTAPMAERFLEVVPPAGCFLGPAVSFTFALVPRCRRNTFRCPQRCCPWPFRGRLPQQ